MKLVFRKNNCEIIKDFFPRTTLLVRSKEKGALTATEKNFNIIEYIWSTGDNLGFHVLHVCKSVYCLVL